MSNVVSYCNAGKRHYGEKHWYWSIWTDISETQARGGVEPTASGFATSKPLAGRAAWKALAERGQSRAYFRHWGSSYLRALAAFDTRPPFSRCSVGKHRWFWVVAEFLEEPLASGIAGSPEAALRDAELKCGPVSPSGNSKAAYEWKKLGALKRSQRESLSSTATEVDLVYECHPSYSDYSADDHHSITPHRVVKRTKKKVFVEREPFREITRSHGDWSDWVRPTFVLDRQVFEETGKADRGGGRNWDRTYYSSPDVYFVEQKKSLGPGCFVVLGLERGCTEKDIKKAYRCLAKVLHPDGGGCAEDFKRLHEAYEKSLEYVKKVEE